MNSVLNSSSIARTTSTRSKESKPKSFWKCAFDVNLSFGILSKRPKTSKTRCSTAFGSCKNESGFAANLRRWKKVVAADTGAVSVGAVNFGVTAAVVVVFVGVTAERWAAIDVVMVRFATALTGFLVTTFFCCFFGRCGFVAFAFANY